MSVKRTSIRTLSLVQVLALALLTGCATLTPEGESVVVVDDKGLMSEGCESLGAITTFGSDENVENSLKIAKYRARNTVGEMGGNRLLVLKQDKFMFADIKLSGEAYRCGRSSDAELTSSENKSTVTVDKCIALGGSVDGHFCQIPLKQ
ncbi:DUF4156 domain-containing protein [Pseudomonadota bacterium]